MVAIVTGQGLGLGASSLGLGQRGQIGSARFGQAGAQVFVNAANGNLLLQGRDQWLAGTGHDAELLRAYNSQGQVAGQWRPGDARRVEGLTGMLNGAGSTVTRTDWDGSAIVYTFDAARSRYVAGSGAGTRATLDWDATASQWRWDDGTGAVREHYAGSGDGRLLERLDRAGNAVRFDYNGAGQLSRVTTANGGVTHLDYAAGRLSQLRTVDIDGSSATAVRYGYDGQGRLSAVTLDLSPADHSIADGQVYTTWYTYEGSSERVATLRSSDGGQLAFAYVEQGGVHRVAQVTQTAATGEVRTTAFAYDLAAGRTTVTDALGGTTVLSYDGQGRLLRLEGPVADGTRAVQQFSYDAHGQVASVTDALGHQVRFSYDGAGNLVRQDDDRGSVLERAFDAGNRLLSQTLSGPTTAAATTRYVYDAAGRLRFVVSATGDVTETRFDAAGQAVSVLRYTQDRFTGASADEAALTAWSATAVRGLERTDTGYDFRGHVAWTRQYARLAADGTGVVDADTVETRYVYDAQGRLLQRQVGAGSAQAAAEHFAYDGLGRLLLATGFSGAHTHYAYDDAAQTVAITQANGLVRTQLYNAARELVGLTESHAGTVLSQLHYHYDAGGRLRMTVGANGGRTHTLYDAAGRPVATVDATGALTESVFDGNGQLVRTIAYATPIPAATLASWVDAQGRPLAIDLAAVRPPVTGEDRRSWRFFDAAGHLIKTVAADGAVVDYQYDAGGRLVRRVQNQQRLSIYQFAQDPTLAKATINDYSAYHTRYFYDGDGRRVGELSASGHLSEWFYDAAGRQTRSVRYANWCASPSGTQDFAAIYRGAGPQTIVTHTRYDTAGRVVAQVDGEGFLTQYSYDARGQRVRQVQGAQVNPSQLTTQTLAGTVVARGVGSGVQLAIRVNGVTVQTVTLDAASRSYAFALTVPVAVDQQVELVALNAGGGRAVIIESAQFGGRAFDADGLWWTADGSAAQAVPGGAQALTDAGTLAWRVDALTLLLDRATVPGVLQTTEYAYDSAGRLLRETQRTAGADTHSEFGYDVMGNLVARTRGERSQLTRLDAQGRVVAELAGEGAAALAALGSTPPASAIEAVWAQWGVRIDYDAAGQRVAQTDALGRRTLFYYDAVGRLSHQVNAAGEVVEYRYTVFGDLAQTLAYGQRVTALSLGGLVGGEVTAAVATLFAGLQDATTRIERRSYTVTGAVAQALDALGYATTYLYNAIGDKPTNYYQELVRGDGGARLTRTQYTAWGELSSVLRGNVDEAWHYDAFGRVIQHSSGAVRGQYPSGIDTHSGYDRNGRVVERSVGGAGAAKERWTFDAFGNVLTQTDKTGHTTTYQVDAFGREVRMTTPEGVQTTTKHNAHGQVIEVVDGRGGRTVHEYDRDGRLVRSTNAAGEVTTQAYDRAGQLTEVVDARGMRTTLAYDAAGRVITRTVDADGLALTTTYAFDAFGQAVEVTDAAGTVTRTTFDGKGQAIEVVHDAGGLNLTTTYVFDGAGQVLRVTEGAGTAAAKVTAYQYDALTGTRTATIVDPDGLALTTRYSYDSRDQVLTRTDALGRTTYYAYDGLGRLAYTVAADGSVVGHGYDAAGRAIATTRYAARIDTSGIAAAWAMPASNEAPNAAWVAARVQPAAGQDRATRTVFDGDGRARYQIDARGFVSETTFDGNGNAVRQVRYASAIALSGSPTTAQVAAALAANGPSPTDRVWQAVYDAANRPVWTVDAAGYVTQQTFDAGGNVVRSTRYALRYGGAVDAAALAAWTATVPAGEQRTMQTLFDGLGRAVFELDALGWGTHIEYNASGHEIARFQHTVAFRAEASAHATAISHAELAAFVAARGPDRQAAPVQGTWQYFDAAGRLRYRVSSSTTAYKEGSDTAVEHRYDAAGQVIGTRVYQMMGVVWTAPTTLAAAQAYLGPMASFGRETTFAYDTAGRLQTRTDPLGTVTRYEVDGLGQVTAEHVAHGTADVRTTRNVYDSQGRLVAQTRAADTAVAATTQYTYDAFGQQVAVTDPRGHELATTDSAWALAQRTARGFVNETGAPLRVADLTAAQQDQLRAMYTRTQAFDAAGNVIRSTDALGATIERTFDAFGNAVRVVDARGYAGTFVFDGRDRVVAQIDPAGYVTVTDYGVDDQATTVQRYLQRYTGDANGDPRGQVSGPVATTTLRYDALGRLIESIDAQGGRETWAHGWTTQGPPRREVVYTNKLGGVVTREYDLQGQLRRERGPVMIGWMLPAETEYVYNGFGELTFKREYISQYVARQTGYAYDQAGQLTRIDHPSPLGAETRSYDRAGNLTSIVDGRGHRSAFYFDAANRQVGQVDGTGALSTTQYDAAGNAIAVRRYATAVALPAGEALPVGSGAYRETLTQVDANGRVVETRIVGVSHGRMVGDTYVYGTSDIVQRWAFDAGGLLVRHTDANGHVTRTFHDAMGQPLLRVDAAGYAVSWERDAEGNVLREIAYAQLHGGTVADDSDPHALIAAWPRSPADRITERTFDLNGRVLTETRRHVAYGVVDPNTGRLTELVGDATTAYQWDAAGNLLRKTDAEGHTQQWEYDQGGRMIAAQGPGVWGPGGLYIRRSEYAYNGLNQIVRETRLGGGFGDQTDTYEYNSAGQQVAKVNALGHRTEFVFDAAGNLSRMSWVRTLSQGQKKNEHTDYAYDAAGRETRRITVSDGQAGVAQRTRYNAFGEVTGRGTGEVGWQVFAEFDNAGRMVNGNADRGITRAYVYDGAGNQTMMMESQATDLRPLTLDQIYARANTHGDVFQTISVYDQRNQLIDVIQPGMDSSGRRLGWTSKPVETLGPGQIGSNVGGRLGGAAQVPAPGNGGSIVTPPYFAPPPSDGHFDKYRWAAADGSDVPNNWPPDLMKHDLYNLPDFSAVFGPDYEVHVEVEGTQSLIQMGAPTKIEPLTGFMVAQPHERNGVVGIHVSLLNERVGDLRYVQVEFQLKVTVKPRNPNTGQSYEVGRSQTVSGLLKWDRDWSWDTRVDLMSGSLETQIDFVMPPEFSSDTLRLPTDAFRSDANPQVYVRPAGSQGPYQSLAVQRDMALGMAMVDIAALADGPYEVLFVSTEVDDEQGLLRREQYHLVVGPGQTITHAAPNTGPAFGMNGAGHFVLTGDALDLIGVRTRHGATPATMTVQVRRPGTTDWTTLAPGGLPPLNPMGSARLALAGLSGDYELQVTLHDGAGTGIDTLRGSLTAGSAVALDFLHEPDVIHLTNLPRNATEVEFRLLHADGSVAAVLPLQTITDPNNVTITIPPSVLAEVGNGAATYTLVATLYDRHVVPATSYTAKGPVQIGPQRNDLDTKLVTDQLFHTVRLDPPGGGEVLVLHYRPDGDIHAPFVPVTLLRDRDDKFSWESLGLDAALTYEYFYDVFTDLAAAQVGDPTTSLVRNRGYFFPEAGPAHEGRWELKPDAGGNDHAIHRSQTYNAFGEVVTEVDGNRNVVTLDYNTQGKLTRKTDPLVEITFANGYRGEVRPLTTFVYDRLGSLVGHRDANGNLTTQAWNYGAATANVAVQWHADGSIKRYHYSVHGNLIAATDGLGRMTNYLYDAGNRLIRIDRPEGPGGGASEAYYYDELGQRTHSTMTGQATFTDYDSAGNVTRTQSAAGRVKAFHQYWVANGDDGHWVKVMTDANGRSSTDTVDAHGRLLSHRDLGGHQFVYEYNHAGLLARSGREGLAQTVYTYYGNGLLLRMRDEESKVEGNYEYDANGNRTFEGFTGKDGDWAFQQSTGTYDALNRLIQVADTRYKIDYEFDAVGNRIRVNSEYTDALGEVQQIQEYWYEYDAMNRFTVTMGQLTNGRGTHAGDTGTRVWQGAGGDGVALSYDLAGQRKTATHASDGHVESYHYDHNGQLTDTYIGGVLRARRINDRYGRVIEYNEYKANGERFKSISHTWDADHLLLQDHDNIKNAGTVTHRLADGTVSHTQTYSADSNDTLVTTTYTYVWFDSAKQIEIKVQADHEDVKSWAPGFSKFIYDNRGRLKLAYDTAGQRGFQYQSDGEGRVLQRDERIGGTVDSNGDVTGAHQNRFHSYYLFGDRQVGNIGNDGIDRIDYAQELAQSEAGINRQGDGRHKRFDPLAGADFDVNYQPINSLYPSAAPGTYIIREGDSLQHIAAALWGDASLWYILAEANGLTLQQKLIPNTTLTIPNKVTNVHNNASTFKPYDAGEAIGSVNPTIPDPLPPGDKGCGGFVQVIAVVIAVVVTIYTAGAAAGLMGAAGGFSGGLAVLGGASGLGAAAAFGAAAIGGAVGSLASQGALIAGGVQDKFDWKSVGLSAVGAGVTAGLGATTAVGDVVSQIGTGWGQAAATGAMNSAVTSGIGSAMDVTSFSWKNVAISAVASGVGYGAGNAIGRGQYGSEGWDDIQSLPAAERTARLAADGGKTFARNLGSGMTVGVASGAARGNLSNQTLTQIGLDVLGTTVGNAIADGAAARSALPSGMAGAVAMGGANTPTYSERVSGSLPSSEDRARTNAISPTFGYEGQTRTGPSVDGVSTSLANDYPAGPDTWNIDERVTVVAEKVQPRWNEGIDFFTQQLAADSQRYSRYSASPTLGNVQVPSAQQIAHYERMGRPMPSMTAHDPMARQQLAQAIAAGGANPLAGAAGAMSSALGGTSADINNAMVRTDAMTGSLLDIVTGGGAARMGSARGGRVRPSGVPLSNVPNSGIARVEFAGGAQEFVADLGHVTGKGAQARNQAIGAIVREDFPGLNLTHQPQYSPFIRTGIAQEGVGTQIGKANFSSRESLRNVIIHEELHHRWWGRGVLDHHPTGSAKEFRFYETIRRYERMRGWGE